MRRLLVPSTALVTATTGLVITSAPPASANPAADCTTVPGTCTVTYNYTGGEQQFSVPAGVTEVSVLAIGAAGLPGDNGSAYWTNPMTSDDPGVYPNCTAFSDRAGGIGGRRGAGAFVKGEISVSGGQSLFVEVGGAASWKDYGGGLPLKSSQGGWNGGGRGGGGNLGGSSTCGGFGGGGGGASDVQTCSISDSKCPARGTTDDPRLIVAAGGGGGGGGGGSNVSPGFVGGSAGQDGAGDIAVKGGAAGRNSSGDASDGSSTSEQLAVGGGGGGGGGYRGGGGGYSGSLGGGAGGGGGTNLVPPGGESGLSGQAAKVVITYDDPSLVAAVNVSGSQTYGGTPSFTYPPSATVSGTLKCDTVNGGTAISTTLPAGSYTLDGSSCSGLTATGRTITYTGAGNGFTVSKAPQSIHFTSTPTLPAYGGSYTPTASGGGSGNPVTFSIEPSSAGICTLSAGTVSFTAVGTCVIDAHQAGNTNYDAPPLVQQSVNVAPAGLVVTASSSSVTYGDPAPTITASYSGFVDGDTESSLATPPTCGTTYVAGDNAGSYDTKCSGASDPDYRFSYSTGALEVKKAATSMSTAPGQLVLVGDDLELGATLTSGATACQSGQPVAFGVEPNPTGGSGDYTVSASTQASGTVSTTLDTAGWADGAYTVTASFPGDSNCLGSSDATTVTVAAPGDAATGGGWLTTSGSGRINVGFTVRQVAGSHPVAYKGHLSLVNTDKWKLVATVGSYGTVDSGSTGIVTGTGDLYRWSAPLNDGLGEWVLAKSGVTYTGTFTATTGSGHGKNATGSPGSFGITIDGYTPTADQPVLPDAAPVDLKGGHIKLS